MLRPDISRLRKNRGIYLKVGFLFSLAFVTYAFTLEAPPAGPLEDYVIVDETVDVIEIPITKQENKKVIPPPPIEDIIEPEPTVETPEYVEELIPENTPVVEVDNPEPIEISEIPPSSPVIAPPVAEKEDVTDIEIDRVWDFVQEMPRFPGCEEMDLNKEERKLCAQKSMMKFIYSNVQYPTMAIRNDIKGTVNVSFVIGKNGKPRDFKVVRTPHPILGREAIRVLKLMPDWTPGKQRFKPVAVRYQLPVKFNIQ